MSIATRMAVQIRYETLVRSCHRFSGNMLVVICQVAVVIIFFAYFCTGWFSRSSRKLPPSPPGNWPILGHLHLFAGAGAPHTRMAELSQKHGPLVFLRLGTKENVLVSSPAMAQEVLKQHNLTFSHRPQISISDQLENTKQGFTFVPNDSSWLKLRRIFTSEIKSAKRRQQNQQLRAEETSNLMKSILADIEAPIELYSKVQTMAVNLLSRVILSRRFSSVRRMDNIVELEELTAVMHEMSYLLGSFDIGDFIPWLSWLDIGGRRKHAVAIHSRMQDILTPFLNEHRAKRKQDGESHVDVDMVDVLLSHQEMEGDESISEENVRAITWDAFMGGTETVSSVTEWAMAHLLHAPRILAKLKTEIDDVVGLHRRVSETDIPQLKYLQAVIKEAFRLHPPAPILTRESHEPCTVAGYYIPAFTTLHVNVWAIGRNPSVWDRPLEFSPDRFMEGASSEINPALGQSFELLPFGSGRRICPGAAYGLVTPQLIVASLVQGFDFSPPREKLDMSETTGIIARMATSLQLHCKPRVPLQSY